MSVQNHLFPFSPDTEAKINGSSSCLKSLSVNRNPHKLWVCEGRGFTLVGLWLRLTWAGLSLSPRLQLWGQRRPLQCVWCHNRSVFMQRERDGTHLWPLSGETCTHTHACTHKWNHLHSGADPELSILPHDLPQQIFHLICWFDFWFFFQSGFFGLQSGRGCRACGCSQSGSLSESCDEEGRCQCVEGVAGVKCDHCSRGYYGFYANSCTGS